MGGLGSGRRKDRARKTVESHLTLDVNLLSEKGCLRPGCSSTCQWIVSNEVVSINLRAEAERLSLSYNVQVGNGERQDIVETISIVRLRCRFGGSRAYFICPGPGGGTDCGRRIAKLHLSRRYFLCRHCNHLAYASQYEQPWERALRRASKLKQRLGIDVGIAVDNGHAGAALGELAGCDHAGGRFADPALWAAECNDGHDIGSPDHVIR